LQALDASSLTLGLIVPLRESGSLLPQVFLGGYLKRFSLRKWAWSLGAWLQGIAIVGIALVSIKMHGTTAGWAILGLLALFSLARGVSSIASKDVLGKTIPKKQRGQLTGWAGSLSGLIALVSAGFFLWLGRAEQSIGMYAAYLLGAAIIWSLAGALQAAVIEQPGEVEVDNSILRNAIKQLGLLRQDRDFRNFVGVRTLAFGSGLSAPFVISMAHDRLGGAAFWLGVVIIMDGLATMVASPIWGRMADRSSRLVLRLAMLAVALILSFVLCLNLVEFPLVVYQFAFPLVFFALGIAHSGVRVGRKTYIVNMAKGNRRTDYVSVANTVIGVLILMVGLLTGLASIISLNLVIASFVLTAALGAGFSYRLPKVSG